MSAGALAAGLALAQTASAGVPTGGSASAQAADVELVFDFPNIDVLGRTQPLTVGPNPGSQTVPGSLDVSDLELSDSSVVATSTSVAVARTTTGVEATASVDGLEVTLLGTTVASATTIVGGASCPAGASAVTAEAQANGVRLGDAAPVDLSAGEPPASGSSTITDEQGQNISVEITASVFVGRETSTAEARGLRLEVTIDNQVPAVAELALASCQRPDAAAEAPEPEGPDDGLADSGTDTAVGAALLGVVLIAGGGSALLWARTAPISGRRSSADGRVCRDDATSVPG